MLCVEVIWLDVWFQNFRDESDFKKSQKRVESEIGSLSKFSDQVCYLCGETSKNSGRRSYLWVSCRFKFQIWLLVSADYLSKKNSKYDRVWVQILRNEPLPILWEVFAYVQNEESCRVAMLHSSSQEQFVFITAKRILGVLMEEKQWMLLRIKGINYSVTIVINHTKKLVWRLQGHPCWHIVLLLQIISLFFLLLLIRCFILYSSCVLKDTLCFQ